MVSPVLDNTISKWARAGVLFGCAPSRRSPDLERLLLDTARHAPRSARLFVHAVSWLSQYDGFVARHRLKRLILDELETDACPVLGLLLDLAIKHGASRELNIAARCCGKAAPARPLFDVHATTTARRQLARRLACPEAKRRGLAAPDVTIKLDALRPPSWILKRNPSFHQRVVRKGDLRSTILETLRYDAHEQALDSESALVQLCAANRPAVSAALDDLEREGLNLRHRDPNDRRRHRIQLPVSARMPTRG